MKNILLIALAWLSMVAMALATISVTESNKHLTNHTRGEISTGATLAITGLSQSADNTIPHGLPRAPFRLACTAQADGAWYEKQAADATNIYIHVDASGPTAFRCDVEY